MEYTLACIWCYYYDDGLEMQLKDFGYKLHAHAGLSRSFPLRPLHKHVGSILHSSSSNKKQLRWIKAWVNQFTLHEKYVKIFIQCVEITV